jgi:hypothetical protein
MNVLPVSSAVLFGAPNIKNSKWNFGSEFEFTTNGTLTSASQSLTCLESSSSVSARNSANSLVQSFEVDSATAAR